MNDRVYRIAPMHRRCCWYVLATVPIVIATYWYFSVPAKAIPFEEAFGASFGIAVIACLVALPPFTWRLAIDRSGWRRRFLGVETLWPWSDFEAGEIAAAGASLRHWQRPWWNPWSYISIGSLRGDDLVAVVETIEHFFPTPQPPEPPGELIVRLWRDKLNLDDKGVHIESPRGEASFSWSDVIAVDVLRCHHRDIDFSSLDIVLPDRVVTLHSSNGQTGGWFSNPPSAEVVAFLRRRTDDGRYTVSFKDEPFVSPRLVERRVKEVANEARFLTWMSNGFLSVVIILSFWEPAGLTSLPVFFAFAWMAWKQRRHARAWRDLLEDDAWRTTPPPRLEM